MKRDPAISSTVGSGGDGLKAGKNKAGSLVSGKKGTLNSDGTSASEPRNKSDPSDIDPAACDLADPAAIDRAEPATGDRGGTGQTPPGPGASRSEEETKPFRGSSPVARQELAKSSSSPGRVGSAAGNSPSGWMRRARTTVNAQRRNLPPGAAVNLTLTSGDESRRGVDGRLSSSAPDVTMDEFVPEDTGGWTNEPGGSGDSDNAGCRTVASA
eukprot:6193688-Pleurochrysis_carterae.AAC.3